MSPSAPSATGNAFQLATSSADGPAASGSGPGAAPIWGWSGAAPATAPSFVPVGDDGGYQRYRAGGVERDVAAGHPEPPLEAEAA